MDSTLQYSVRQLTKGAYLGLRGAQGHTVAVFGGQVWITQDGDHRDVFVGSGGTFTIDRTGLTLVEALQDASLLVLAPDTPAMETPVERRIMAPPLSLRQAARAPRIGKDRQ